MSQQITPKVKKAYIPSERDSVSRVRKVLMVCGTKESVVAMAAR